MLTAGALIVLMSELTGIEVEIVLSWRNILVALTDRPSKTRKA